MSDKKKVLMVGIGGYALSYLNVIFPKYDQMPFELVGGVDPFAEKSPMYPEFVKRNIPIYNTIEEFYAAQTADVAVIVTPIHFHAPQIIYALRHGSDVLTEKPVCATVDEVNEVIRVRDETGRKVSVGYQWSHSRAVLGLKQDVLDGKYGKLLRMKSIVLWPRDFAYYARGCGWAAKKKTADGHWILDSVAANATAHYLHNMFFVAGDALDKAAPVKELQVETYRANHIEMFDTCALRAKLTNGAEALYLVTHAVHPDEIRNPEFIFEFENGTAWCRPTAEGILIEGKIGEAQITYGYPNCEDIEKLLRMVRVNAGTDSVVCGPETACIHTQCINATEELIPDTPYFPGNITVELPDRIYVKGLADAFNRCYDEWKLPSELGCDWAKPAKCMDLLNYRHFAPKE